MKVVDVFWDCHVESVVVIVFVVTCYECGVML